MRWLAGLLLLATPGAAATCEDITHLGASYTICEALPGRDLIFTALWDENGDVLGSFDALESLSRRRFYDTEFKDEGALAFAMNAGMYHEDRRPVGLYREDEVEYMRVVTSAGPGNFGLLPNGIFCISDLNAFVYETSYYTEHSPDCIHASQSGPMLVIDGALHPRLIEGGTSKFIRNGVGATTDGTRLVFAISNEPVNFHDFGTLFRDRLGLPNALYFDGKVSRLYHRDSGRSDFGWQMGPMVGVIDPAQ